MRPRGTGLRLALLALATIVVMAGAAGPAAAQAEAPWELTVDVADFEAPLRPLSEEVGTPITVNASCAALAAGGGRATVALTVAEMPPWMNATFSPSTVTLDSGSCDSATATATGTATLLAKVSADAPAFTDTPFTVEASLDAPMGERATATGNVTADYFSILDATTATSVIVAEPQRQVDLPITVTNFGNAATTLHLTADAPDAIQVVLPGAITVDSKQQGAPSNQRTLLVSLQTPYKNGYTNAQGVVTLDVRSHYALDDAITGDTSRVSVTVHTKGFYAPGPGAVALPALLAAAALATRLRKR